jgi:GTPase
VSGFDGRAPHEAFKALNRELKLYSAALIEKPQIIAATKLDVTDAEAAFKDLQKKLKKTKIYPISAVSGEGVDALLRAVAKALDEAPEAPLFLPERAEYVIEPDFSVEKGSDGVFHVKGKKIDALVARTHLDQDEAVARLQNILKKMGVEKELERRGAKTGNQVSLGGFEFTYRPE